MVDNETVNSVIWEKIIWRADLHGVDRFLNIYDVDSNNNRGLFCMADSLRGDSFIQWLFGFDLNDPDAGIPSVAGMLHLMGDYTYKGPGRKNGIECQTWEGTWNIPQWDANLAVTYYWADGEKWTTTSGTGKTVPVSAVIEGKANINNNITQLSMTLDFTNFFEIEYPETHYQPRPELWCDGRKMTDPLPDLEHFFSYDSEAVFTYTNDRGEVFDIIAPRSEWYDHDLLLSRTDYKPLDLENINMDPFDSKIGMVSEVRDFITGLSYTMDKTFGNCSIDYIVEDPASGFVEENGKLRMRNFLASLFENKTYAYNQMFDERGIQMDAFIRSGPGYPYASSSENFTTVVYLTASAWEVEDGANTERLLPARIIEFPTQKANMYEQRISMNIFAYSRNLDFDVFDISSCITKKMHIMIRMGWNPAMDIEKTFRLFERATRETVTIWGKVTPIRVQNIEVDIDFDNKAYFVIFTLVGYPPGMGDQLNELPDAVRKLAEIRDNLASAVDKGWFQIPVQKNDGSGGVIISQAEKGSLTVLEDRSGSYSYEDKGYSSGAMAALGIIMLLLTTGGVVALLIWVLKW